MPQSKSAQNARIAALWTFIDVEHVRKQIGRYRVLTDAASDVDVALQPIWSMSDLTEYACPRE